MTQRASITGTVDYREGDATDITSDRGRAKSM